MKILHTADWHLGKKLENFQRLPEQEKVLDEICEIADKEQVNAVVVAGDIFDTVNPPIDAVELLYKTLKRLSDNGNRAVVVIAGNHDSPDRINAPDPIAKYNGIFFFGYPNTFIKPVKLETGLEITKSDEGFIELKLPSCNKKLRIIATAYANENRLRTALNAEDKETELRNIISEHWQNLADKYCDTNGVNILLTHHFVIKKGAEAKETADDEKNILYLGGAQSIFTNQIPEQINYTALGHLHRFIKMQNGKSPVVYSGSPVAYSFSEQNQDKFALVVSFDKDAASIEKHKLNNGKRLMRVSFDNIEEAEQWLLQNPETLVELSIKVDEFLTASQRKRIFNAHNGIVNLIPVSTKQEQENDDENFSINEDIEKLFIKYFQTKKNIEPNEEILNIFRELNS